MGPCVNVSPMSHLLLYFCSSCTFYNTILFPLLLVSNTIMIVTCYHFGLLLSQLLSVIIRICLSVTIKFVTAAMHCYHFCYLVFPLLTNLLYTKYQNKQNPER